MLSAAAAIAAASGGAATAGEPHNCSNPSTFADARSCAERDYSHADDALNKAYRDARDRLRRLDSERPASGEQKPAGVALRDAQRLWIQFRDEACAAEARLAATSTAAAVADISCKERLTTRRTLDLRRIGATP